MSLEIRGGKVFHGDPTVEREGPLVLDGGVIVEGGGSALPIDRRLTGSAVIDASGCIVLPGFVIAHHHLYSALARGMPGPSEAPTSFLEVLERVWWRLDRALDGDLNELSGLLGTLESLRCGVTGVIDHHASPNAIDGSLDRIAAGVRRAGGRAVVCYEATDRHGDAGFEAGLAENARMLAATKNDPLIRAMVGGHAPFTLSDEHLAMLAELARRHDAAVHIHVAEAADDQLDAQRRGAVNVTTRLAEAGVLDGRAVLAHGVHLDDAELTRIGTHAGVWLTHQPRSNMNNHVGYFDRARRHPRLALGTDGINGDLFDEAHAAYFKLRDHDAAGAAEAVWSWLAGSWRLLSESFGLEPEQGFGWLNPGCPADVVVLDYDTPTPVHAGNLPWHLAFGISARHVRDVIVAGKVVVKDRVSTTVDPLAAEAASGAERLWAKMAELK
jgi:putative selenium metabolism protein SsnA